MIKVVIEQEMRGEKRREWRERNMCETKRQGGLEHRVTRRVSGTPAEDG